MNINREQAQQYIQELQALRNKRLDFVLSQGVHLEDLIADMMNELETLYIIRRAEMDQDPTGDEVNS